MTTFECCFCGQGIKPVPPDPASLLYTTCKFGRPELQKDQEIFCHTQCLRSRLHPSVHLYAAFLVEEAMKERN